MATITPTLFAEPDSRTRIYQWEQINEDDEGGSIKISPAYADKTLIAQGTFNGGALTLEVSADGTNFVAAVDAQGDAVTFVAAGSVVVGSNAPFYRLSNDNNGTTEDVDAFLVCALG